MDCVNEDRKIQENDGIICYYHYQFGEHQFLSDLEH